MEIKDSSTDEWTGKDNQMNKLIEVILGEMKIRVEIPIPPPDPKHN
jgi:hypothetical protein